MLLEGHSGEVYTIRFSPKGEALASGSFDKSIMLWSLSGNCDSYMMLQGHRNAVLEVHWSTDGDGLVSCGPDKSVRVWDAQTGEQAQRLTGHEGVVNTCCLGPSKAPYLALSAGDDCRTRLWDLRSGECVQRFDEKYQVVAACFSEEAEKVFTGGIEEKVRAWDLRRADEAFSLGGHRDTITGMQLSPDGTKLLTNSVDCTLRAWDVQPYAPQGREVGVFTGHSHNFERNLLRCSWSGDGGKVTCGSADRMVYVWDAESGKLVYKLPGHNGSVNESVFHPHEPVVASCSSDGTIYLGELDA